ncbi:MULTISPECIES: SulP family inorganic anion transporter [unclassified Afipia]|uniref:SLC26A/SulP transporter family protein n=1 Tax=unclassified Afipia TaxID=2642050 RepID=UPI000466106A|nr:MULTISPECIES: SulP family inorganic anion transporter [unclassified Afipia]MAH70527.1 sulfate permease [Afipia sp.]OUX60344.1 MAG: sulfate permease [Afipia sp. TMED4]HAP46328.1 STAS domain-containing protein [Afipia sp.]HAQ93354.1 STAS domain-containing protein [Afipia sp.]HBF53969.1 STAS domain-containing protein [Afipia sp.]
MSRVAFPSVSRVPSPHVKLRAWLNDIFASAAPAVLTVSFGLSYSVLIFSGPLSEYLPYGIAATFIATAIIAIVVALGSTFPIAVGGPETSTAAVTAILATSVVEHITATDPSAHLLGPVLLTLSAATIITGLALCSLGLTRIGRAIRYVPYPVIGGFLGATALLIALGGVRVITNMSLRFDNLASFADPMTMYELLAGIALAFTIYLTWHRSRNPLALPALLIAGVVVTHIVFNFAGISLEQAQALGWTFQSLPRATFSLPWHLGDIENYPWQAVPGLIGNLIAVIFVTAISTLFNTTGLEVATSREANLERELNVAGAANILSGLFGGYAGCISLSRSLLNFNGGATGRLSGLTVAVIAVLMLVADPALLSFMPKFILGGLLIYLGVDQLNRWIIESRRRLSTIEYLSLLAIIFIIVKWGFIAGVLIGTVIGCATFALSASRISSIKFGFNGAEYRSSLDRSQHDLALLAAHGKEIHGLNLQSYLFFGSANRLYQHVKTLLEHHPECRYLVFDFKLVTGIDSSAAYSFAQIRRSAIENDVKLVLVNLPRAAEKMLRSGEFLAGDILIMPDLDHALEWCENEIIARHSGLEQEEGDLQGWFAGILGNEHDAAELARRCERLEVRAFETIARAGEPADSVLFILNGRIGVIVDAGGGHSTRVRSLGRHTTVGEMGLVARQPRSATIRAETDSVLYVLRADAFNAITASNPALGQKLLTYFMSVLAERLTFASRMIGVLRR